MEPTVLKPVVMTACAILALGLGGCEKVATIEAPAAGQGMHLQPLPQHRVRFSYDYAPDSFRAAVLNSEVSPQDITGQFAPKPVARGVSTASAANLFYGKGASTLRVEGRVQGFNPFRGLVDEVVFQPPQLTIVKIGTPDEYLELNEDVNFTATVVAPRPPKEALTIFVTVQPEDRVSLNGLAAGATAVVTMPPSDNKAAFQMRGLVRGDITVRARALGYAAARSNGRIK